MPFSRFALVTTVVFGVISCGESQHVDYLELIPRSTSARSAPWVEFMRAPEVSSWFDTSRIVGDRTGAVDVTLSTDYARAKTFGDDTTAKYTRMDWPVTLDCAARRVQERGMILYDAAGHVFSQWTPKTPEPSVSLDEHAAKKVIFWACHRLAQLERQPPGDYGLPVP
ncbi:MAG TPA: hypothetical protein VJ802_07645 [Gemmatimonadaceae bacterium]|nr:hypothetical protein [Gemmatimonadaceae bacterium]